MAQQRLWVALLLILLLKSKPTESHRYIVGDNEGWTYGVSGWQNGKVFYHNNVLVFNYEAGIHNVVRVNRQEYETCQPKPSSKTYNSGHDEFKLKRGMNYFICGVHGHCQLAGMKISINAH
ncbi:Chemocyanin [Dendrobium catenatum]|uniref:Plantacyanin n=1 Tax=Dendrobium catenatum TaxID=906689 RepID=A0A2I0WAR2_9ASPA|nr:Chemocyanin [Dendrobium catenatum]